MVTKTKISDALKKLLTKKPGLLAAKALADPKLANRIKNALLLPIKKEGVLPSGKKVKPKSVGYAKILKKIDKVNKTSRFYKRFFSNLTFTGRFFNSFKATIEQKRSKLGNTSVLFKAFPTGDHKPYQTSEKKTGKKVGKSISNKDLGEYLIAGGRDYTDIGTKAKAKITKSMKAAILKEFKLNLKRK